MIRRLTENVGRFFMRRPVQRKYAAKAAHGPRGEQGKNSPARFHRPMQWKYAAKAAHGPRGEQGKNSPARLHRVVQRKLLLTQRAPRRQAEKLYSISCISAPFIFSLRISRILITLFNQFDIIFLYFFLIFFNYLSIIIFFMHDLA